MIFKRAKHNERAGSFGIIMQSAKLCMRNIRGNKKQSFLTCLGITIGIASIITMTAIMDISMNSTSEQLMELGLSDIILILYDSPLRPHGLYDSELAKIESIPNVKTISKLSGLNGHTAVTANRKTEKEVSVLGRDADFGSEYKPEKILEGRYFSENECQKRKKVCVINNKLSQKLFGDNSPIGKEISLGGVYYKIIGVEKYQEFSLDRDSDTKFFITIPNSVMAERYGVLPKKYLIVVNGEDFETSNYVNNVLSDYLNDLYHEDHPEYSDNYYIGYVGNELKEELEKLAQAATKQALIAGICLVIGGIGIMNMMMVSVNQRSREIGLRKACGATPARIQIQFVFEAIMLSLTGGAVGIIIGMIATVIINIVITTLLASEFGGDSSKFFFNSKGLIIAVVFSVVTGVVFGWVPARKASKLNPIDALKL